MPFDSVCDRAHRNDADAPVLGSCGLGEVKSDSTLALRSPGLHMYVSERKVSAAALDRYVSRDRSELDGFLGVWAS